MYGVHVFRHATSRRPIRSQRRQSCNLLVNAFTRRFQDWRRWLRMGIVDVACPMAYTTDTAVFQKQIEVATSTAHAAGRRIWAGIGAYRIPAESPIEKINTPRTTAAHGILLAS